MYPLPLMDRSGYPIRPFEPADYDSEARIHAELDPTVVYSARELEHWESQSFQPPFLLRKLVATDPSSGTVVGVASLESAIEHYEPGAYWLNVAVDRRHQGRGIGRALASALSVEAEQLGARRMWAAAQSDDPRGLQFLARQGFVEVRRSWRARLTLAEAPDLEDRSEELRREGVTFTTLAAEGPEDPGTLQSVYALSSVVSQDEPSLGPYTPPPFELFVELEVRGPSALPDAYFLARHGGRYVGMSALRRLEAQSDALQQAFTGTLREFRGRGIATELKRRGLEYARQHGYRWIFVGNDSLNAPMLAINRKLGFRPERQRVVGERRIDREPPSASS